MERASASNTPASIHSVLPAWWAERYLGEARWLVEHGYSPDESLAQLTGLMG